MDAASHLKEGRLEESLAGLLEDIRRKPEDVTLRLFLFQLAAVLGQWDRCQTQLRLVETLGPETQWLGKVFQQVVQAEFVRSQVFAGKLAPLLFGEPEEWMGWFVQALTLVNQGSLAQAKALREQALEAAPANAGTVNGRPFAWIMDADPRTGTVPGSHYWRFLLLGSLQPHPPNSRGEAK